MLDHDAPEKVKQNKMFNIKVNKTVWNKNTDSKLILEYNNKIDTIEIKTFEDTFQLKLSKKGLNRIPYMYDSERIDKSCGIIFSDTIVVFVE